LLGGFQTPPMGGLPSHHAGTGAAWQVSLAPWPVCSTHTEAPSRRGVQTRGDSSGVARSRSLPSTISQWGASRSVQTPELRSDHRALALKANSLAFAALSGCVYGQLVPQSLPVASWTPTSMTCAAGSCFRTSHCPLTLQPIESIARAFRTVISVSRRVARAGSFFSVFTPGKPRRGFPGAALVVLLLPTGSADPWAYPRA
jgi:hypothetical protein